MLVSVSGCSLPSTLSLSPFINTFFRLLALTLTAQHKGQVVHASQCARLGWKGDL
jgi:hypothetical protein